MHWGISSMIYGKITSALGDNHQYIGGQSSVHWGMVDLRGTLDFKPNDLRQQSYFKRHL